MTTYPRPTDPVQALGRADGSTVAHSDDHGRVIDIWENVKYHGAKGNLKMTTELASGFVEGADWPDDTAAIQAAIDTSFPDNDFYDLSGNDNHTKTIYIPRGHYRISSTLEVPRGCTLRGAGMGSVLVNRLKNSDPVVSLAAGSTVENLMFYGQENYSCNSSGPAILVPGTSGAPRTQVTIRGCWFRGIEGTGTFAIDATWALELLIERCVFSGIEGGGIALRETGNASVIDKCTLSNNGGALGGILIDGPHGVTVRSSVIENWQGSYGIYVASGTGTKIDRTWFENNWGNDWHIASGSDVKFDSCSSSQTGAGSTVNSVYIAPQADATATKTFVEIDRCNITAVIDINNQGAADKKILVFTNNLLAGQGAAAAGDFDMTGVVAPASVFICRNGDRHDRLGGALVSGLELIGTGSLLRMEDARIYFGSSTDASGDPGAVQLYRTGDLTLGTDTAFRLGAYAHASLPSAAASGIQWASVYCTGHKQLLTSDGANWVEQDGTNH